MAYTTQADLIERYGAGFLVQLSDRSDPPAGTIDTNVVDRAIEDATATIDGYVRARYALPFATVPEQVPPICRILAIYNLHRFQPDSKIETDYKDAMRQLRDIAEGRLKLEAAGAIAEGAAENGVEVTTREQPFTRDKMTGLI